MMSDRQGNGSEMGSSLSNEEWMNTTSADRGMFYTESRSCPALPFVFLENPRTTLMTAPARILYKSVVLTHPPSSA